jgi:hypothetical protein
MTQWIFKGQTVNPKYYLEVLMRTSEKERDRTVKEQIMDSAQENAPVHSALAVKQFLANKCIPVLAPPPP